MASFSMNFFKISLFLTLFSSLQLLLVHSTELDVGDDKGWLLPSSKNDQIYNQWASKHRFQIDDTIRFNYKKDSVLVVTDAEYEKCRSVHPIFFSNNGNTVFKFEHPGLFYFISGVAGHCERGQKMIIKVLEPASSGVQPASSGDQNATTKTTSPPSGAVSTAGISSSMIIVQFAMSVFGFILMI